MQTGLTPDQVKRTFQEKVVELITRKLESGEMNPERAKEIAQMILEKFPEQMTDNDIINIIPKLDDQFEELAAIVVPMTLEYERKMREEINKTIDLHLQAKEFDKVLQITKGAIEQEKNLT